MLSAPATITMPTRRGAVFRLKNARMMRAIILIPLAYLLISAALLGLVLVILRGEAMDTGERLTSALARVIEE